MLEFLESLDIESGITLFLIGVSISLLILHVVAFVSIARLHSDLNRIADELKFINYILGGADSSKGGRDILNAINDKLLDELAMFMFENKQDLSSFKGAKILVKTGKDGLEFSFEND